MFSHYALRSVLACAGIGVEGKADHDLLVTSSRFVWSTLLGGGTVTLGEAYMRGEWSCKRMDLFFELLIRSGLGEQFPDLRSYLHRLSSVLINHQSKRRSRRVAKKHYDIDAAFYAKLLGPTFNYTSAVYELGVKGLDEAQHYKMTLVGKKIPTLRAGMRVVDIGCGWGGLMEVLAREFGARCTGLSISTTQLNYARQKYAESNLPLDFRFCDYRDFDESVDFVTSICMSEHVGVANLPGFFAKARSLVAEGGYMVWQGILTDAPWNRVNGFLDKYIFPGGETPTKEEALAAAAQSWHIVDEHYFGESYYKTLMAWHANLVSMRDEVLEKFDEEFYRMFEFYLLMCAGAYKAGKLNVVQLALAATPQPDYVPVR